MYQHVWENPSELEIYDRTDQNGLCGSCTVTVVDLQNFLLVDLRDFFFFRFRVEGVGAKKKL